MSQYINFDENKLNSYYLSSGVFSSYVAVTNVLLHSDLNFGSTAELIAKGQCPAKFWVDSNIMKNMVGSLLKTKYLPIMANYTYTYNGSVQFSDVFNLRNKFTEPQLPEMPNPIAVRYVDKNGRYYIERPPFKMEVDISVNTHSRLSGNVSIWIPWTLTVLDPSAPWGAKVFFGSKSLQDNNTRYVSSILPNSYADGSICFGRSQNNYDINNLLNSHLKVRELYSIVFNEYMNGGWNIDLGPNIRHLVPSLYKKGSAVEFYSTMTASDILKKYPRIKASTAEKIVDFARFNNRLLEFKYMFYSLSRMSLEQTLQFYEELAVQKNKEGVFSFEEILNKSEALGDSYRTYDYLTSRLHSALEVSYESSRSSSVEFSVIMTNYSEMMAEKNFDIFHANNFSMYYLNTIISKFFPEEIIKFTENELKNPTSIIDGYPHTPVYILDAQTREYERVITPSHSEGLKNFYFDFVKQYYCVPYDIASEVFS